MSGRWVLVTGGAGLIGSHLVDRLVGRGDEVALVDNFDLFYDPTAKRSNIGRYVAIRAIALFEADIWDRAAMEQVFREVRPQVVVQLAAKGGVRSSLEDLRSYDEVESHGPG